MTNQKKFKPRKTETLMRKAVTPLDARCLAMKRRARENAEITVGKAVSAAAEAYDRVMCGQDHPGYNPEEGAWEDLETEDPLEQPGRDNSKTPTPVPPSANAIGTQYAYGLNQGFYSGRRQLEESQWRTQYPAMFPVFLTCQQKTANWSNPASSSTDWKAPCNCTGSPRTLDVLDLWGELDDQLQATSWNFPS